MKRYLSLLAAGLITVGAATSSQAQIKFGGIVLTNGAGSNTLQGPSSGTNTYSLPAAAGNTTLLTSESGQSILGALTLGGAPSTAGTLNMFDGAAASGALTFSSNVFGMNKGLAITGALTGVTTLTASGVITTTATSNQIVLGTTKTTTVSATAPASSRTYTLPDAGADANVILSESGAGQTINGGLTVSGTTNLNTAAANSSITNIATGATNTGAVNINSGGGSANVNIGSATGGNIALAVDATKFISLTGLTSAAPDKFLAVDASNNIIKSSASVVSGTGTQNTLPKWNNAGGTTLGDSKLTDIGTALAYNANFTVTSAGAVSGVTTLSAAGPLSLTDATAPTIATTDTKGLTITDGTNTLASVIDNGTSGTLQAGILNATTGIRVAGAATSGTILIGGGTNYTGSTATYPNTTTANQLLYSSAANTIGGLATGNNGALVTDGSGVPSISSTLPNAVQDNITRLGTVTVGKWNSDLITGKYGGTGVDNGTKTITLGGNFATSGAFDVTLTATGTTNVTLPTSGTLATTANTVVFDVNATQTSTTATKNLFDVTSNVTGASLGAKITATGTTSATGLTVTSTGGGAGTATGLSIAASGGTVNNAINVTAGNVSVTGNIVTTGSGSITSAGAVTVGTSLVGSGTNKTAQTYTLTGGTATEVIANTLLTASSTVVAVMQTGNVLVQKVVPASGQMTVTFSSAPAASDKIMYIIVN